MPASRSPARISRRRLHPVVEFLRLLGASAWFAIVEFYNSANLSYAAAIAYYALLSLFPCILLAFALLGSAVSDEGGRQAVVSFVLRYFPAHFDFLTEQIDAIRQTRLSLGVLGIVSLLWAALGVFGGISTAVNYAWGVEKQRSYLRHKLFSFLMLLAAGGLLLAALVVLSFVQISGSSTFTRLANVPGLTSLAAFALRYATALMLIFVVGLIFYFVPNTKVRFRDVWAGAVMTGLLWQAAFIGFSYYVRDMSRFSNVHGSIAAVVVFLVWVYVSAVILLYGVEFTAMYAKLRTASAAKIAAVEKDVMERAEVGELRRVETR